MATVEITGLKSLINRMNALGKNLDIVVDNAVHKSALQIQKAAKENIRTVTATAGGHVYKAFDTGNLYRHINAERLAPGAWAVGTAVEYGPYIEFGTGSEGDPSVAHTTRPRWVYYNKAVGGYRTAYPQPARPFLRPAFESHKEIVFKNVRNAIVRAALTGGTE